MNRLHFFVVLFISFLISCGTGDEQRKFEQDSMKTPRGITRTNADGEILSTDPDDWRISPFYINAIEILRPAYPNPTINTPVKIEFLISSLDAIPGMRIFVQRNDYSTLLVYQNPHSVLPVGLISVSIDPQSFNVSGTHTGTNGLHRVFVYDLRERLITYGDIQLD